MSLDPFLENFSIDLDDDEPDTLDCEEKGIDAESVDALTQWGGWGIRGVRGATGYIARSGSALRITVRTDQGMSTFVFSCADPAALMQKLRGGESGVARDADAL